MPKWTIPSYWCPECDPLIEKSPIPAFWSLNAPGGLFYVCRECGQVFGGNIKAIQYLASIK